MYINIFGNTTLFVDVYITARLVFTLWNVYLLTNILKIITTKLSI